MQARKKNGSLSNLSPAVNMSQDPWKKMMLFLKLGQIYTVEVNGRAWVNECFFL